MRVTRKACLSMTVIFLTTACWSASGGKSPVYAPPPPDLPGPSDDIPWPNDPPDLFDDPFDPINDLPDPFDFPFPPEDPLDFPLPDPFDLPDPPDLPDPFADDVPSLFPDPFDDLPDFPELPLPEAQLEGRAAVASNVLTRLMPFPMRIPFHPAYSGRSAAPTGRNCNAATASK